MVNCIEKLFQGQHCTMLFNNVLFTIHPKNQTCQKSQQLESNSINTKTSELISSLYPKNKSLHLLFNILLNHQLINDELFFVDFPSIHIADFCSFVNNRFSKKEQVKSEFIKLCKYLQQKNLKFPRISIKNPIAQKMLT
jgi:hypothetical protein